MKALDDVLRRRLGEAREVSVEQEGRRARVRAVQAGPVGAEVEELEVGVERAAPLDRAVRETCRRVRGLGERLVPVEVDPGLGGAVLRSDPEEMRERRYFEARVEPGRVRLGRYRALPEGGRVREPFPVTFEGLGRLVEDLAEGLEGAGPG